MFTYRKEFKRQSKDSAMKRHCENRFQERFGIRLTKNMVQNMISQITKQKSEFVCAQSRSRTVHIVNVLEKNFRVAVVYNKEKGLIHTIFPVEWIENGSFERYQDQRKFVYG